jgi:adenylosuccinate synthase
MPITAILGSQWGDEGKGKVAAHFSRTADIGARFQGGPNAGHTLYVNGKKTVFRMVPCGILFAPRAVIGNGVVINPRILIDEVEILKAFIPDILDRLSISDAAHIILSTHIERDNRSLAQSIGTTKMGVGPTYTDKIARSGIRVFDILRPSLWGNLPANDLPVAQRFADMFAPCCRNTSVLMRECLDHGLTAIAEGAQGALLDIDHGDYPFVTSSNTTIGAVLTGLGVGPRDIGAVYIVASAYMTKVGGGLLPTKISGTIAEYLQTRGDEIDGATNLLRDCGWLDLRALRRAARINQPDGLILTKLDVMSGLQEVRLVSGEEDQPRELSLAGWCVDLPAMRKWEDLPKEIRNYISCIEEEVHVPVVALSTGPETENFLARD